MKNLLFVLSLFISVAAFSQDDKIYMHNGKAVEGTVVRVAEFTVIFKYANEDAEQTVGKYAVEKIVYGKSGREEKVTDKISVLSKDDWEKVVMLVDKSEAAGLTKVNEVKGKTAMINDRTAAGSSAKS
jgi:sRNA-binding regulator protein Hfq